ncbi:MAG: ABC transporter substrate-binding protein, partial [Opitutales bacterium]
MVAWLAGMGTASAATGGNDTLSAMGTATTVLPTEAAVFPRTFTDGADRTVKLTAKPERIISLSPAITEMVLAIGGEKELVGVTRYCTVPERIPPVVRVGGLLDPDYEEMVALRPDLVLAPNLASPQLLERLESLGLTVVVMNPEGLDNLPRDFRLLGQATGRDDKGEALATQFQDLRALARARLQSLPADQRPTAVIIYAPDLLAPSPKAFAGQLLEEAGARNVVPAGGTAWQELTPEALLKLDPAIVFLVRDPGSGPWPPPDQPALQGLSAVRKGRVVDLPESLFLRPGALQGEALWTLAHELHPDLFPETTSLEAL